jgi:7-cyano-7-deazaguanine synthase
MSHPSQLAVVLVSGGMDSCVTAAIARTLHAELAFLHCNYGHRTETRELKAFHDIADHYGVKRRLSVDLKHLKAIGGSSLTDDSLPVTAMNLHASTIPTSYVPFRNANLLAIATSWAEVLGAHRIYIGAVFEDATGYPDCRPVFYEAFNRVIETGTKPGSGIRVETPVIHLSKAQIVKKGLELSAPLHLSWSCYQSEDQACGRCDSCGFRLKGFFQAGVEDPIPYATRSAFTQQWQAEPT